MSLRLKNLLSKVFPLSGLEKIINWSCKNSLRFLVVTDGCSDGRQLVEKISVPAQACVNKRLQGTSPRQADVLVVNGSFSHRGAINLKHIFRRMVAPKWVMAVGNCAISGGMFNSYSCQQGIDELLPVDIYVPGCPPSENSLQSGLEQLRDKIEAENLSLPFLEQEKGRTHEGKN